MSSILYRINSVLSRVVASVPIGTNLGLFHLLWMLLSGRLLQSRGAVIPGLAAFGLSDAAVRRAWAALAYGRWHTSTLLAAWQKLVQDDGAWQVHRHGGYRPVAIPVGIAARIGSVGTQRLALPCLLVRTTADEPGEAALQRELLHQTQALLATDEALVTDRGFPLCRPARAPRAPLMV